MMSNYVKGFGIFFTVCVASEIIYQLYKTIIQRPKDDEQTESRNAVTDDVLFFPDKQIACKDFFVGDRGCSNLRCRYTHEENALSKLFKKLASARSSLDVCVFLICSMDLGELLIDAHKKGVKVRVICDDEQVDISGSQIWKFRKEGINVRTDHSSYLMHHKFVIIDKTVLLNGSFNWTRQGISGNQENLMIVNSKELVASYSREFEKLWMEFDPQRGQ